jgi:hypothetical protein
LRWRKRRLIFFFLAILLGAAAGIGYGWIINPVNYTDTGPETLSSDYQADYVLMVAELYHTDGDPVMAVARLKYLGDQPPLEILDSAIAFAQEHQYASGDQQIMSVLRQAISQLFPEVE